MLAQFKNLQIERMQLEELVALLVFAKQFRDEFDGLNVEPPSYVDTNLKALRREITGRIADDLEKQKRELVARLDSLKTPSQRKAELQKQLSTIEKQLSAN
jgi:hypothetical protein